MRNVDDVDIEAKNEANTNNVGNQKEKDNSVIKNEVLPKINEDNEKETVLTKQTKEQENKDEHESDDDEVDLTQQGSSIEEKLEQNEKESDFAEVDMTQQGTSIETSSCSYYQQNILLNPENMVRIYYPQYINKSVIGRFHIMTVFEFFANKEDKEKGNKTRTGSIDYVEAAITKEDNKDPPNTEDETLHSIYNAKVYAENFLKNRGITFEGKFTARFKPDNINRDGPSAGCSITTAMISAGLHQTPFNDVAILGKIGILGDIEYVGGLKWKTMAAKKGGINKLIMPTTMSEQWDSLESNLKIGFDVFIRDHYSDAFPLLFNN